MLNQRKAGALLSYASLLVNGIISFVYVPLLLSHLTQAEYGVYELIGSIISYLSVMDVGLSTTLTRFYVKAKSDSENGSVENLLAMAAIIYVLITVLAILVGMGVDSSLEILFLATFTEAELKLAHQMMLLVILNCAVVLPGNWFLALINANERFVFARVLSIVKYAMQILVVWVVLVCKGDAVGVLAVQVALNAIVVLFYVVYCRRNLSISCRLVRWDWALFRGLASFSFFVLLNMVFDQVFWKTGQVVLGAVCGAAAVAVYGVVCKVITSAYMQISTGLTSVFLPKLTAVASRTEDMGEINELFIRIGRLQAIMIWGTCAAFIAIGRQFVLLWAGSDFADAYPAIVVLMLGLSISLIQNLGISILQAKNKQAFRSVLYIVAAGLDLVVSIPVSREFGVIGCALTAAILLFLCTGPIMNIYYARVVKLDIKQFIGSVTPLIVPAALAGTATYLAADWFFPTVSWLALAGEAAFFLAFYTLVLWGGWLNRYEKAILAYPFRMLRRRGRVD